MPTSLLEHVDELNSYVRVELKHSFLTTINHAAHFHSHAHQVLFPQPAAIFSTHLFIMTTILQTDFE